MWFYILTDLPTLIIYSLINHYVQNEKDIYTNKPSHLLFSNHSILLSTIYHINSTNKTGKNITHVSSGLWNCWESVTLYNVYSRLLWVESCIINSQKKKQIINKTLRYILVRNIFAFRIYGPISYFLSDKNLLDFFFLYSFIFLLLYGTLVRFEYFIMVLFCFPVIFLFIIFSIYFLLLFISI